MKASDMLDNVDAILDMDDPNFAKKLAEAIGIEPGDTVQLSTPQFTRTDGLNVPVPQIDFASLPSFSPATLKSIGCQRWDEPDKDGNTLWLYPAEWYQIIPDGTPIVDISGNHETFKRGETDDDMRYGALAYGFLRKETP